jgi:hypothetical protein
VKNYATASRRGKQAFFATRGDFCGSSRGLAWWQPKASTNKSGAKRKSQLFLTQK